MKNIAIITGGQSGERKISLRSAENIANIVAKRYPVKTFVFPEESEAFIKEKENIVLVIPVIHGKGGEDGEVQKWLRNMDKAFLFSPIESHKLALQKERAKKYVEQEGIYSPEGYVATREERGKYPGYTVVIKPNDGGSSVATRVVSSQNEYDEALEAVFAVAEQALIERRIEGREFTVGVVDIKRTPTALPVVEIIAASFFDYEQKYNTKKLAEEICPANIDQTLTARLQEIALKVHGSMSCTHMTRTDIMMDTEGKLWFLEINTIPGYTKTSLLPKMLKAARISEEKLFQDWIEEMIPEEG